MNPNITAALAVLLALGAFAMVLNQDPEPAELTGVKDTRNNLEATQPLEDDIKKLRAEMRLVAADVASLRADMKSALKTMDSTSSKMPGAENDGEDASLKDQVAQMRSSFKPILEMMERSAAQKSSLEQKINNPNLSNFERLTYLNTLRSLPFGYNEPTTEAMQSLVKMWQDTPQSRARRDVIRRMMGIKNEVVVLPLIDSLSKDEEEDVREEAADYLGFFLDDPRAVKALENAVENDPNPKVQRHARKALGNRR